MFKQSNRESSLTLIAPERSAQFLYRSTIAWNSVYKKALAKPHSDLTTTISHFKNEIKKMLLTKQKDGGENEWQKSNFKLY